MLFRSKKLAVQAWREKALAPFEHPVPAANFHVTALFLGQLSPAQLDDLGQQLEHLAHSAFSIRFDRLGYWAKPKILWLGSQNIPQQAVELSDKLTAMAKLCKIQVQERKYIPHITLVRKHTGPVPAPLFEPDFECRFDTLHLFESVSGHHGVQYHSRYAWPLRPF